MLPLFHFFLLRKDRDYKQFMQTNQENTKNIIAENINFGKEMEEANAKHYYKYEEEQAEILNQSMLLELLPSPTQKE